MNFLELINQCLLELNYRQVNSFTELVKNDHKKIKAVLNIINKEICNIEGWNFLIRRKTLTLPANITEINNTVEGRILYLLIDGEQYNFCQDVEPFLTNNAKPRTFSVLYDQLLFPKFDENKTIDVIYYTKNSVVDSNGVEKEDLENPTDLTLIPMPFAQQLLVYGTCLRLKGNPQHIRFSYWVSMYKEALLNLKSKTCIYAKDTPQIQLFRG
ncbi:hypothetical protein IJ579_06745 [bacterium]|nr:hypothetical protein [bacterium]